jgi:hypothetical protein
VSGSLGGVQATDHSTGLPGELHSTAPHQTTLLRAEKVRPHLRRRRCTAGFPSVVYREAARP